MDAWRAVVWIGLLGCSSCQPNAQAADEPNGAASSQASASRPAPPPDNAPKVDLASIQDDQLVAAVLAQCHHPLQKRMQQVTVTVTLPDARRFVVHADLPSKVRVTFQTHDFLWLDGVVHRLDEAPQSEAETEAASYRAIIPQLARVVDAAAFGPLYRAKQCKRDGKAFVLTDASGNTQRLQLYDGTLLPSALSYGQETLRVHGYLHTSAWIVSSITTDSLGTCAITFEDGGVLFPGDFFVPKDDPTSKLPAANAMRMTAPGTVREQESTTPIVVVGKRIQWVALPDGGDWATRHQTYTPIHEQLEANKQQIFGFPMLWREAGEQWLGVPFRQREDGPALQAPPGWHIQSSPETRQLVVYPPNGSIEDRIRAGTAQLQRAADNRKLKMIGPIVAQPFLHLHDGVPDHDKVANCKVRVSVRIQSP